MAGIYIHIPFCKQACHYCDFHFSTSLQYKNELLENLLKEIEIRKNYLQSEPIETIYFGGGTPSLLTAKELSSILDKIRVSFELNDHIEYTLEANPDDIHPEKMRDYADMGINRLSIGIQSFYDEDLKYMNRSHDAKQAERCIEIAQRYGIENISIDLIFGYPLLTQQKWENNIATALKFRVPHLSCYAMTVEPKTALDYFIKSKKTPPINHEQSAAQFEYLMDVLQANEYEHYEISNYARPQKRSKHNSNYWKGIPYLGFGPSAHSFDGESRQWNVANNIHYIRMLSEGNYSFEKEILSEEQKLNEKIMISLRTIEGLDITSVAENLTADQFALWEKNMQRILGGEMMILDKRYLKLTKNGKLLADYLASELFV